MFDVSSAKCLQDIRGVVDLYDVKLIEERWPLCSYMTRVGSGAL